MRLPVLQDLVEFGLAYDGVNDVRGAQRDVQIRKIVLMQQRGVQGRNHHDVDVREIVLQQQAVMRLFAEGDSMPQSIMAQSRRMAGFMERESYDARSRMTS